MTLTPIFAIAQQHHTEEEVVVEAARTRPGTDQIRTIDTAEIATTTTNELKVEAKTTIRIVVGTRTEIGEPIAIRLIRPNSRNGRRRLIRPPSIIVMLATLS